MIITVSDRKGAVSVPRDLSNSDYNTGHRRRLRERFLKSGPDTIADYELLELVLFQSRPRGDVKPLAKFLLERFGSFAETISAPPEDLMKVRGVGESTAIALKAYVPQPSGLCNIKFRNVPSSPPGPN